MYLMFNMFGLFLLMLHVYCTCWIFKIKISFFFMNFKVMGTQLPKPGTGFGGPGTFGPLSGPSKKHVFRVFLSIAT